ncbi:GldG family protein [Geminocystis herdmanii]|uniref:GldG family protein n=1 Tax=Geminocystis herdmanii TaxID=669359 RepID=UPI000361F58B|nr:Gldg family protein [Geminocystis herdmanii]
MKKYILFCFILGIFLISVGVVLQQINTNLANLVIAMVGGGIAVFIAGGVIFLYTNRGFWGKRSTEVTVNAIISTVTLLFILGLVNFLGLRYSLKFDLTENQLYTLSPQSQQLVKNLNQPMTVYVFDSPSNDFDRKLLKDYARKNNLFQYQFVDPQVSINLAQKFNVTRLGDVYLESGDRKQLVQTVSPQSRLSEVKLTNAIAKIQQTSQPIIYILQGHGEPSIEAGQNSISQAVTTLTDKGYIVYPLTLATSPLIPPDADVLIINNPEKELLQGEIKVIEKYLEDGGNLLVMYNAQTNVNLDPILQQWGVKFDDRLVVDASGAGEVFGLGPSVTIVVEYGNHPITQDFNNGITLFPWARAIITDSRENIITTPLLITNSQSWGENNPEGETVELDTTVDLPGPLNIGVALAKKNPLRDASQPQEDTLNKENDKLELNNDLPSLEPKKEDQESDLPSPPTIKTPQETTLDVVKQDKPSETRMVVIGNGNFATDGWFQQQLNGDLFVNTVAWLGNQDDRTLSISPKEATNRRINLSGFQASLITWLAIIIIPALGFTVSIVTWWQRSR